MGCDFLDRSNLLSNAWFYGHGLDPAKFMYCLLKKNENCDKEEGSGKVVYYFICHYRLGMEPQTRNCGARQGYDPPAIPLSAIIIKPTFFCLPLKTLLKKSLSGRVMHSSELEFPFWPWCESLPSPCMLVRALGSTPPAVI